MRELKNEKIQSYFGGSKAQLIIINYRNRFQLVTGETYMIRKWTNSCFICSYRYILKTTRFKPRKPLSLLNLNFFRNFENLKCQE